MMDEFPSDEFQGAQDRLRRATAVWRAESTRVAPPPEVGLAVAAACRRAADARRRRSWAWALATVTAVVLAFAALDWSKRHPTPEVARNSPAPFVSLPYVVQPSPSELTDVIHVNVPVAELISVGLALPYDPARIAEADVLIGQDGRARAVRVIAVLD